MDNIKKDIQYILKNIEKVKKVKKITFSLRKKLIDLTLENKITEKNFYKITSLLSPQSRSILWQKKYLYPKS